MSGGMWDYLSNTLEDAAAETDRSARGMTLLAAIEHEMDWGISGDTCYECAKLRVIAALETYFGDRGYSSQAAMAVARDEKQNLCETCQKRETERKAKEK